MGTLVPGAARQRRNVLPNPLPPPTTLARPGTAQRKPRAKYVLQAYKFRNRKKVLERECAIERKSDTCELLLESKNNQAHGISVFVRGAAM